MDVRTLPGRTWAMMITALALGAAACGPASADKAGVPIVRPVVLTMADGEVDPAGAQPFADAVSRLSHGTLYIQIHSNWQPSDSNYETDLIKTVQARKFALGITASRAFDTVGIDAFQALQAPFLIDNYVLEQKVLDSGIPAGMLAALRPLGVIGLGILPGPLRRPFDFTRPLVAVSDYRNARIGIRPSELTADMFRALGAIPVTQQRSASSPGEITTGFDGIEDHAGNIDAGFAIPGAVLTGNVVFGPRPNVIFMNQRAFSALTPSQRDVLLRAAVQARHAPIFEANDPFAVADLCRRGTRVVSASPADIAALLAAVRPIYAKLEANPSTKSYIGQITALRQAVGGSPDTLTCPPPEATGHITTRPSPLDGTWQQNCTEAQAVAATPGGNPGVPSEGNWGDFILTLSRGRWWQRLTGGDPGVEPFNILLYGTYVLTGDRVLFYRHDHDYTSSDTEVWGPYTWTVYRDTLTLTPDFVGDTSPLACFVRTWHMAGT